MSQPYDFPDDPIVFERVLQHFRSMNAADWDACIARYAREEDSYLPESQQTSRTDLVIGNQAVKHIAPRIKRVKRRRGASYK